MGLDRSAFFGKHIEICSTARPCRTLLTSRAGTITLDPAWSPAGNGMAFISAPAWKTWGFRNPARYRRWLRAHVLWTARTDGSGAARAGAEVPAGAQDPEWTRDGRGILFVRDGALWLDPHLGAANPTPIARLVPSHAAPGLHRPAFQGWYYGHMDWHDLFAWY
jgi:dipeptidyl aminopeptidase/acylaminoacyl peptidase